MWAGRLHWREIRWAPSGISKSLTFLRSFLLSQSIRPKSNTIFCLTGWGWYKPGCQSSDSMTAKGVWGPSTFSTYSFQFILFSILSLQPFLCCSWFSQIRNFSGIISLTSTPLSLNAKIKGRVVGFGERSGHKCKYSIWNILSTYPKAYQFTDMDISESLTLGKCVTLESSLTSLYLSFLICEI